MTGHWLAHSATSQPPGLRIVTSIFVRACLVAVSRKGMRIVSRVIFSLVGIAMMSASAMADQSCCCGHWETVECTVMCPQMCPETRTVCVTDWKCEQRTRSYTCCKKVAVKEMKSCCYTVMVPHCETRTEEYCVLVPYQEQCTKTYTVCVPYQEQCQGTRTVREVVMEQKEVPYTVSVPYTEQMTGTRKVARQVQVQKTRTVQVDEGHWVMVPHPKNPCKCKRQWCPCIVCKECPYTCCETVCEDEQYTYCVTKHRCEQRTRTVCCPKTVCKEVPYTYCVTKHRQEERTCTYCVNKCRKETRTREVQCRTCVAEQRTREYEVTRWETVSEEKTQDYTVRIPVQTEKEITVMVRKMVPQTVSKLVWVADNAGGACGAGDGACGGCGHCDKCCN